MSRLVVPLVVIGLLALLISVLLPALNHMRTKAHAAWAAGTYCPVVHRGSTTDGSPDG